MSEPLMSFKSHIEGKNADVTIYSDHVEWTKEGLMGTKGKLALGAMTGGLSLLKTGVKGRQEGAEVIPVKAISSVTSEKDGLRFTKVTVVCSGNTIDFRVGHDQAPPVKGLLTDLMLGRHPSQTVAAPPPPPPAVPPAAYGSVAEELKKLAELRDAGILSDDEFQAQKAKLLG